VFNKIPTLDKLYIFKERLFTKFGVDLFVKFLSSIGVTPNIITILSIFVGLISVFYLFVSTTLFSAFYITNRLLDILDGYMARKLGIRTPIGDRLDHFGDLLVHAILLIKTILQPNLGLLGIAVLLTYLGEYLLLKEGKLLNKKFPTGTFAYFFIFDLYKLGLIYQIVYQTISYTYLKFVMKPETDSLGKNRLATKTQIY